jgi:dethiobiotin synthetase
LTVLVVTGTGTGVGKTIVTAAVAALARHRGWPVVVVKPVQTGVFPGEPGDLAEIERLSGIRETVEGKRYPTPLSPAAAARLIGQPPIDLRGVARHITDELEPRSRLVLVEGAGGLLVRYDEEGATIASLAYQLGAPLVVVTEPGLGTLNATALTLEAMAHRGLQLAGLVIGSWPAEPDLASRSNIRDLEMLAARPLSGALNAGAGRLAAAEFLTAALAGLGPAFGGRFDAADFRRRYDPARRFRP